MTSWRTSGSLRAFTLLEIMMAVAILSIVAAAIYQFTDVSLESANFYTKTGDLESVRAGLRRLVEAELSAIPAGIPGALFGLRSHGREGERDSLQVVCQPGNGVLSAEARGNYEVLLEVREWPRKSGRFALGIERRPHDDDDDDDDDDDNPATAATSLHPHINLPADWVPLIEGVRNLEINYFDARLNGWVEKWTDQTTLPNLVRVRFADENGQQPYEFVARVPAGGIRDGATVFVPAPVRTPGGLPQVPVTPTRR